jgi:hypothetical protein
MLSIVVMDEVEIHPPYVAESVVAREGADQRALDRVKKIVEEQLKAN